MVFDVLVAIYELKLIRRELDKSWDSADREYFSPGKLFSDFFDHMTTHRLHRRAVFLVQSVGIPFTELADIGMLHLRDFIQ